MLKETEASPFSFVGAPSALLLSHKFRGERAEGARPALTTAGLGAAGAETVARGAQPCSRGALTARGVPVTPAREMRCPSLHTADPSEDLYTSAHHGANSRKAIPDRDARS